jgi:hypothetical protein
MTRCSRVAESRGLSAPVRARCRGRVLHSQDTSALEAGKTYDLAAFRKLPDLTSSPPLPISQLSETAR